LYQNQKNTQLKKLININLIKYMIPRTIEEIYNNLYPRRDNSDIYAYQDLLLSLLSHGHLPENLEHENISDADNEFYYVILNYRHPKLSDNLIEINHFDGKSIDSIEDVYRLIESITNQINNINNLIQ